MESFFFVYLSLSFYQDCGLRLRKTLSFFSYSFFLKFMPRFRNLCHLPVDSTRFFLLHLIAFYHLFHTFAFLFETITFLRLFHSLFSCNKARSTQHDDTLPIQVKTMLTNLVKLMNYPWIHTIVIDWHTSILLYRLYL